MIRNNHGKKKEYIYQSDIRKYLETNNAEAKRIFLEVKDYEKEVLVIEMFKNRVPQDLFHAYRKRKKSPHGE